MENTRFSWKQSNSKALVKIGLISELDFAIAWVVIQTISAGIFIPISPHLPLPILFFLPFGRYFIKRATLLAFIRQLISPWFLAVVSFFVLYRVLGDGIANLPYVISMVLLVALLTIFIRYYDCNKFGWLFLIAILISSIFFILRVRDNELANKIYNSIWGIARSPVSTGFTATLFDYGYQLAAIFPVCITLCIGHYDKKIRFLGFIAFVFISYCIGVSGQRSAAIGAISSSMLLLLFLRGKKKIYLILLLLILFSLLFFVPGIGANYLIIKVQSYSDYEWRSSLQIRAIDTILDYPLGLFLSNTKWAKIAKDLIGVENISAHNAYLVHVLNMGWLAAIWIAFTLGLSLLKFFRKLQISFANGEKYYYMRLGLTLGFVSVLLNALFHNASLFTLESSTIILYCALWMWPINQTSCQSRV